MQTGVRLIFCFAVLVSLAGCAAEPPGRAAQSGAVLSERNVADVRRGQLLYDTACLACHKEQVHWREKRLVHDWPSLLYQVARWQEIAGQRWSGEEIIDVAAYLNTRIYKVPCPVAGCLGDRVGSTFDSPGRGVASSNCASGLWDYSGHLSGQGLRPTRWQAYPLAAAAQASTRFP